jgi:hypothetical protein
MARFAQKSVTATAKAWTPTAKNDAGGVAFKQTPKLEFASALMTCMTTDTYYKSAGDQVSRISELAKSIEDPLFAAKAAIFTRKQNGLRSVSHIVAGELSQRVDVKGQPWLKSFFQKVVNRPDDITETLSYIKASGNPNLRKLSNALKKGFGAALSGFDEYQLAKYLGNGKEVNLFDAVNLLHPKATPALQALMKGTLKPAETWEVKMTQAGQKATSDEDKASMKGQVWKDLLTQNKLGYLACLRNLRNIGEQASDALPLALAFLTDPKQVQKSLIMPFQIYTAVEALAGSVGNQREVKLALDKAMELSLSNVPKFEGKTFIAVDCSGSMGGRSIQIAALMAAVLFKSNNADVMLFDTAIRHMDLHPGDSLTTLTAKIHKAATGGGTSFHLIFEGAKKAYDRVIILSDMQAWVGGGYYSSLPHDSFKAYKKKFNCNPRVFSFDLTGQGTLQFPEDRVYALAGFSDAILKVMQNLEKDPQALVHEIEQVSLA